MSTLDALLETWRLQLRSWAAEGAISRSAVDALQLKEAPKALRELVARWASGQFQELPPVVVLPASAMPGAAGAYAISTGTIYLNGRWLQGASQEQALAVLTEELGHHLDAQLNSADGLGDEGELFSLLLQRRGLISLQERQALQGEDDRGHVLVAGQEMEVEQARVISTPIRVSSPGRTDAEWANHYAFAALKSDGSVVTWGYEWSGGDSSRVAHQLRSGVVQIYSTALAFAALKSDGSVVTWGYPDSGGDSSGVASELRLGVKQIFSSSGAFAALKSNGSVVTWGGSSSGGNSNGVASQLRAGVVQICSTASAFAALKSDGSVVSWGDSESGASSGVASELRSGVVQIFSSSGAFAALKSDGSVVTWGIPSLGGDSGAVAEQLGSGISNIFSGSKGFVALGKDGSVTNWGPSMDPLVAQRLTSGVTSVYSNEWGAFAALKKDGSVVTWGEYWAGGDSTMVANNLRSGVTELFATASAFAALKDDGSVVTWGGSAWGWGPSGSDSSLVASKLSRNVKKIFSTVSAFAALKMDGSVVTWGDPLYGGNSSIVSDYGVEISSVASELTSDVVHIFTTYYGSFAALKADGSVVTWGRNVRGGDSSGVASQLRSGVVAFANPFTDDRLVADQPLPVGSTYAIERLNQANLNSDGNEGSRHFFRIKRSGNTALAGSVRFSTSNGTATSGVDFLPFSRDIQFLAGEDKKDVYVDSRKDSLNEGTERFNVSITKINARDTIAKASTYGEIFNLPPASTYSIERRSSDGKEGYRHTFLIKREGDLSRPGQVRVSTSSNSATSGVDFNAYSAVRNFAINQDEQIVYVDSRNDSLKEGTERFNISLSIVRSQDKLNVATTFGQIFDVPPPSTYSIETLNTLDRKSDGLEGSRHYFRVKRSGNTAVSGLIRFSTSSGSAISNNDFLPYSTTIVFQPGEIEKYVYVDSIVDSLNEGAENLKASISKISPQDILGSSSVVGVIRNRIINYNGVDKDGFPFVMKGIKSDPNWSVRFRLKDNRINPVLPTYVYIHGWQDSSNSPNSNLIFSAFSAAGANVINVDWRELASVKKGLRPLEAATVTRQVGECLADFLIKSSIDPASTTIIGHSLGSFVAASAANKFRLRTGKRIKELVALDTANNPLGPYDIDARNSQDDAPLFFFNDLALSTSSYTASDLVGGLPSSAGDNARAATAQNAYLVQYARSSNLPGLGDEQATAFHNGVIGVYADLFKKKLLHPSNTGLNTADRFDASGRLTSLPSPLNFDGVVVAATPWSWKDNGFKQDVILSAPKAIGWTDRYASPEIHGSEVNDIIFFDQFLEAHDGSTLFGKGGNDSLIANQTDGNGVDRLIGGTGSDQFWFGYRRYGKTILPYLDKDDKTTFGGTAYAVVIDFNSSQDRLNFGWARNEISVRMGSSIHTSFSSLPGVGFFANNDLVAYVPGLMLGSVQNLIRDNRIAFNQMAILDSSLIA